MDKRAKAILLKRYWSAAGWRKDGECAITPEELDYAKKQSVMFEALTISQSDLIAQLDTVVQAISVQKVVGAFLCSLTNRRLDWRSGLGSYANAKRLLRQPNVPEYYYGHGNDIDITILNFERVKWGGVRHSVGLYNWLDLSLLLKETIPPPTQRDIEMLQALLDCINAARPADTPVQLRDRLQEVVRASKSERYILIEILSCAGILQPLDDNRRIPSNHDWTFALHWRGEDKYNRDMVHFYFGRYGVT